MALWGKLLGGMFGFVLGGPLGAVIGVALGHNFDSGLARLAHDAEPELSPGETDRIQMVFFTATFSLMGYISKVDGKVSRQEIQLAEAVMDKMSLSPELREAAIKLFDAGKQPEFDWQAAVLQFRSESRRRTNLIRMFLEIQIQASLADGIMDSAEEQALLRISHLLGFHEAIFRQLEQLVRASMGVGNASGGYRNGSSDSGRAGGRSSRDPSPGLNIKDAYGLLGVEPSSAKPEVKRAYRRLMSQHHPDKLIAKGLPEEMMKLATEKTQQIQKAYQLVSESRGWK